MVNKFDVIASYPDFLATMPSKEVAPIDIWRDTHAMMNMYKGQVQNRPLIVAFEKNVPALEVDFPSRANRRMATLCSCMIR